MSPIVSVSIPDELLKELDLLEQHLGFSGRSEAVRAGIRLLMAERERITRLQGTVDAALLVVHDDHLTAKVAHIRHAHEHIIKTQVHNHLENHKCCEIFVVRGPATKVRTLTEQLRALKSLDTVLLVPL